MRLGLMLVKVRGRDGVERMEAFEAAGIVRLSEVVGGTKIFLRGGMDLTAVEPITSLVDRHNALLVCRLNHAAGRDRILFPERATAGPEG